MPMTYTPTKELPVLDQLGGRNPFALYRDLLVGVTASSDQPIVSAEIGEPNIPPPEGMDALLTQDIQGWAAYPPLRGTEAFRTAVHGWFTRLHWPGSDPQAATKSGNARQPYVPVTRPPAEFDAFDPEQQIVPVAGAREALNFLLLDLVGSTKKANPAVLVPEPFYHVWSAAPLLTQARVVYIPLDPRGFPDYRSVSRADWEDAVTVLLCSPSNPSGAVAAWDDYAFLLEQADRCDFTIIHDACYADSGAVCGIDYPFDAAATAVTAGSAATSAGSAATSKGSADAAATAVTAVTAVDGRFPVLTGMAHLNPTLRRCFFVCSLSKRASVPGLRVGALIGGKAEMQAHFRLRAAVAPHVAWPLLHVATHLFNEEDHARQVRVTLAERRAVAHDILQDYPGYIAPESAFFLWLPVPSPMTGEQAATKLLEQAGIRVLPGRYLCAPRKRGEPSPGDGFIRVALVSTKRTESCAEPWLVDMKKTLLG